MAESADELYARLERVRQLKRNAHTLSSKSAPKDDAYEQHRERAGARQRDQSASRREIGPLPKVADPERRQACGDDLLIYLETYFPQTFTNPWSDPQRSLIERVEQVIRHGGKHARALHRKGGKTSILERAITWALFYGHRNYGLLLGGDGPHAEQLLTTVKSELMNNELLYADFPEFIYPIWMLEGIAQRKLTLDGKLVGVRWLKDRIVFPTIAGTAAQSQILRTGSLLGATHGFKHIAQDGRQYRPDFVLIDEAQSRLSAQSETQCKRRESIIASAVAGLSAPGVTLGAVLASTVIRRGDLVDRIIDRTRHPSWRGEKDRFVLAWPKKEDLWREYGRIRQADFEGGGDGRDATAFYEKHRESMDDGAGVCNPYLFEPDAGEISAIQHAWNRRLDNEEAFFSEYQNEPLDDADDSPASGLSVRVIESRMIDLPIGRVPQDAQILTCGIDVHDKALYWLVAAWGQEMTGHVVSYGCYPKQRRRHFSLRSITNTLQRKCPGAGIEGAIRAGLRALLVDLFDRKWMLDGGDGELAIGRVLVDANYHVSTDIVYEIARRPPAGVGRGIIIPSHGIGVSAKRKPLNQYSRKKGDRLGPNWRIPGQATRGIRHIIADVNYWKSVCAARLLQQPGDSGALTLPALEGGHRLLCEHFTAERPHVVEAKGRRVEEWEKIDDDNHWLDCLVMAAVAASTLGVNPPGATARSPKPKRKRRASVEYL